MHIMKLVLVLAVAGCSRDGPGAGEAEQDPDMLLRAGCLVETQHKWDGDILWRSFVTYDEHGGVVFEEWDYDDDGSVDVTVVQENDDDGDPLVAETYDGADTLYQVEAWVYDGLGHLARYERDIGSTVLGDPDGEPEEIQTFLTLPDGRRILADVDLDGDGAWEDRYVHSYDADGYPLGWRVVDPEGAEQSGWFLSWSDDHTEVLQVWDSDADGYHEEALRQFYEVHDGEERLVASEGDADGDWDFEQSFTYEYDGDRLVGYQGGLDSLQEEYTLTYDADGRLDRTKAIVWLGADGPAPEELKVFWDNTWTCPAP